MIDYIVLVALAAGFYVGWNIGANDAANAVGAPVGGRVISYRQAISILILFVLLGAVLEGWKVMETVGSGILFSKSGAGNPLKALPEIAVVALFAAGVWVTTATTFELPVSTSQSIVGSVIGAGLLLSYRNPAAAPDTAVRFGVLKDIGIAWILAPVATAIFAYLIYNVMSQILRRIGSALTLNRIFGALTIGVGAFLAYTLGTNDAGAAMGLVLAVAGDNSFLSVNMIALFGGLALAVGAITYSRKVMYTVGSGITKLDPLTAFSAQFGAAFIVWNFNQFGIPVSTTQAIIGGIAGAGLVKGTAAVSKGKLGEIGVAWVLTPTVAAGLTFGLGWLVLGV